MLFREKAIIPLDSVDSTNNYAASLLKLSRPPEGTVITALEQTAGRGQRGAVWQSEKGENLLLSMILYPPFSTPEDLFSLSECVSLALSDVLSDLSEKDAWIKWPNDLVIEHHKVSGMLVEYTWADNRVQSAIVGIGVNLNQRHFDWPNASSLLALTGKRLDRIRVLEQLTDRIEWYYIRLRSGHRAALHQEYCSRLYRINEPSQFLLGEKEITATITGVSLTGKLQLVAEDGRHLTCDLKEISLRYPKG
jgi:BirA family transcriptional regulator, biotin operon repressor / biotin---[acetyl-CoA-carboxylase] ligase